MTYEKISSSLTSCSWRPWKRGRGGNVGEKKEEKEWPNFEENYKSTDPRHLMNSKNKKTVKEDRNYHL